MQIDYFDNHNSGWDSGETSSSGLQLKLNIEDKSVEILNRLEDPYDDIYTKSQGSFWRADNGNHLVGYGSIAKIKEYGPDGDLRMTIQFGEDNLVQSYRSYRQDWHATPAYKQKIAVKNQVIYMSWNGATEVTRWDILTGNSTEELNSMGKIGKKGFETSFNLTESVSLVQVAAYSGDELLHKSDVIPGF